MTKKKKLTLLMLPILMTLFLAFALTACGANASGTYTVTDVRLDNPNEVEVEDTFNTTGLASIKTALTAEAISIVLNADGTVTLNNFDKFAAARGNTNYTEPEEDIAWEQHGNKIVFSSYDFLGDDFETENQPVATLVGSTIELSLPIDEDVSLVIIFTKGTSNT